MRFIRRFGFTIIELMLTIGIIGTIAGIVIAAINPSAQLTTAYDAGRRSTVRSLEQAIAQYTIDVGQVPGHVPMPTSAETAMPICRPSGSGGTCMLLNELAPDYLGQMPIDGSEENDEWTGYSVYLDGPQVRVIADHLGQTGNRLLASSTYFGHRTYGGTASDYGYGIANVDQDSYIIVGTTSSVDGDITSFLGIASSASSSSATAVYTNADVWIVKVSSAGTIMWQRNIGSSANDYGLEIEPTSDGGFIIGGYTYGNNNDVSLFIGMLDIWIVKIDADGNIEWDTSLGGLYQDMIMDISATQDGGSLITGLQSTSSSYSGPSKVFKLDSGGNLEWEATTPYQTNGSQDGGAIQAQDRSGYYYSISSSSLDAPLVKLDNNGVQQWMLTYGGSGQDYCFDLLYLQDGNILMLCSSSSSDGDVPENNGNVDAWLLKVDESGTIIWTTVIGGDATERPRAAVQADNGDIIVAGYTNSTSIAGLSNPHGHWNGSGLFFSIDPDDGNLNWIQIMGSNAEDELFDVIQTEQGDFVAVGRLCSSTGSPAPVQGSCDVWAVKFDSDGVIQQ